MSGVLRLAAEHLERAADPAAGRDLNELRAAELALILEQSDQLIEDLRPDDDDAQVLSPIAWAWLLPLLAQHSLRPSDSVLEAIFERAASPFIRLCVLQAATATSDGDHDPWLLSRVRNIGSDLASDDSARIGEAIVFGQLLLQLGNEPARMAFRVLLEVTPLQVSRALSQFVLPDAPGYSDWFGGNERFHD